MNLSQKAKKAVAAGLAVSTLMWSAAVFVAPLAVAAPHSEGCLVNSGGTVYLISGGQRRGFTSAEVFASHGYNFGQVVAANAEDNAIPVGPIQVYADGSIVKGPNDPLVYLVANGQKRGFVSGSVFTGLGYAFSNIQWAPVNTFSDLPTGSNVESATERHPAGTWVKDGTGTVWMMTASGRKGVPSMEVFNSYGKSWATVVAANAADLAASNEGVLSARATCSGGSIPGTGSMTVSVSGPAATTLVATQATANLADFVFSGTGTVTSVTFERIGVSADTTLAGVYLFDGAVRLTDAATVGSGSKITFTGSNLFTVNGSKTISVKSDIASGTAGQTIGVRLVSYTDSNTNTVSVSGNLHSIASATLATVSIGDASASPSTATIDAANETRLWQSDLSVAGDEVILTRLALRQTGSINAGDVRNFKLLVDGVQVASASSVDANGYVTFSGFSKELLTGTRTLRVTADITGGATRTLTMSLRSKADIDLRDAGFGVNVSASGTFPESAGTLTIGQGTMTAVKATNSVSGNVTKDANDAVLGSYTLTANGEAVKVETLTVGYAHVTSADAAETSTLRNARVLINGVQYGNTSTLVKTGTSFTVNYTVQPGSPITVEVRADMFDNDGTNAVSSGDKITASLITGVDNATALTSLTALDIPGSDLAANQLTVAIGSIAMSKQATYNNQSTTVPQTAYKLGSFNLTGSSTEDVNINEISVDLATPTGASFDYDDLSNVYVKYGSSTSSVKTSLTSAEDITWSIPFTLAKNVVVPVEIYATIGSTITADDSIQTEATITGTTAQSATSVTTGEITGQVITYAAGSIASSVDASAPVAKMLYDNQTVDAHAVKFTATNDSYTVTEIVLTIPSAGTTTVQNVMLKDNGAIVQTRPGSTTVSFTGLSIAVPANGSKVVTIALQLGTVGSGAGNSGQTSIVTMDSFKATNSQGAVTENSTDRTGNNAYVYAAVPVITTASLPTQTLSNGSMTLGKFTVTAEGGPIAWKKIIFTVTKSSAPVVTNATVWDMESNTEVAGADTIATLGSTNLAGTIAFVATNEQQVSTSKTYELRADVASAVDDDSISTRIAQPSSWVTPDDYTAVAATAASFVWSDLSGVGHDATSTTVLDWNNDFLVRTLPTTLQSLSW